MKNMNQKDCIHIKFTEGLGIFDNHYGYPVIDEQEIYNELTGKVVEIQGTQVHDWRNFFVHEGKEVNFESKEKHQIVCQLSTVNQGWIGRAVDRSMGKGMAPQ